MVHLEKLSKLYPRKDGDVTAIDKVSLHVKKGEFVVVRGPSGSGKTTLLFCTGGMLRPTEGLVVADGQDIYTLSKRERARFRAEKIGFIFQMFHLVPYLNLIDNVLLPSGVGSDRYKQKDAVELLECLNLKDRMHHKPSELSAGEKQRTAIARAMLKHPKIILADEPTGNLDPENSEEIIGHLVEFQRSGCTVITVSHGKDVDQYADRIVHLEEGRIHK